MKAEVHVRSQHSRGSSAHTFGGPDTYVAVTVAPDDAVVPRVLNEKILRKRGIKIRYFGEGYKEHDGPRSMLGMALARAHAFARAVNEKAVAVTKNEIGCPQRPSMTEGYPNLHNPRPKLDELDLAYRELLSDEGDKA